MPMLSYVFLQSLLGYGATNTVQVLSAVANARSPIDMSESELRACGVTPSQLKRKAAALRNAERVLAQCKRDGISIVTFNDVRYPENLRNIFAPAVVLYVMGDMPSFNDRLLVTVVGSRSSSDYGKQAAFSLSARLSLAGAVIVSGDAVGGDSFAHHGAMAVGGKSIAVTGGGIKSNYLLKSDSLRRKIIASGGALVSEFQPEFTPHGKGSFHVRNRILAGLSQITAVTEAGAASGTLITAHLAAEFGRSVYAMPGKPNDANAVGTLNLIKDGATPLISPRDLLSEYCGDKPNIDINNMEAVGAKELKREFLLSEAAPQRQAKAPKRRSFAEKQAEPKASKQKSIAPKSAKMPPEKQLSPDMLAVYTSLNTEGASVDDLAAATGLEINRILVALTRLELLGLAKSLYGSKYALK